MSIAQDTLASTKLPVNIYDEVKEISQAMITINEGFKALRSYGIGCTLKEGLEGMWHHHLVMPLSGRMDHL